MNLLDTFNFFATLFLVILLLFTSFYTFLISTPFYVKSTLKWRSNETNAQNVR